MPYENDKELTTVAYQCWWGYKTNSLIPSGLPEALKEVRDFYSGNQYELSYDGPKPSINLVREYIEKVPAKIVGTQWAVEFTSSDSNGTGDLDDFYAFQMEMMNDKDTTTRICKTAFTDGVGIAFTAYDEDTFGTRGKYRGFLKREIVPVERTFYADTHCENLQDQRYIGYVMSMELGAVKDVVEREYGEKLKKEKEKKLKNLVSDVMFGVDGLIDENKQDSDVNKCTVVVRFFRDKHGEVVFEMATRNVNLFITPHYLNPNVNKTFREKLENIDENEEELDKKIRDYADQASGRYTLFEKPAKMTEKEYERQKAKFTRYPVSVYIPYPKNNAVVGESGAAKLVPNQKIVNYMWQLAIKAGIREADPKWRVKAEALNGQQIDDTGGQVITDYTRYSTGWGVDILQTSVNAKNILDTISVFTAFIKQTNGFDNLTADNMGGDTSGYAIQQVLKQQNLTLEIPQQRLWLYIKENALNDLMYFRFYCDKGADYFRSIGGGQVMEQEAYREMAQNVASATNQNLVGADETGQLPPVQKKQPRRIESEEFTKDWEVSVEVTQGIANSQISESQHYNQVFQYSASGNIDATLMKAWIEADPAFSRKTRENLKSALSYVENSQLAMKDAEIEELKQMVQQQNKALKYYGQQVQLANEQVKALKKSVNENAKLNEAVAMDAVQKSEGEVKSDNARGINGQTFDQNVSASLLADL